jgi:hypothetical protein
MSSRSSRHSEEGSGYNARIKKSERRARRERRIHAQRVRKRLFIGISVALATLGFLVWALYLRSRDFEKSPEDRPYKFSPSSSKRLW